MPKKETSIRLMILTAIFAALILVTTYLFHLPIGLNGGYIHFGDAFIYLAACLLPTPYAIAAAAVGAGLSDLASGAAVWILPTIIIKPLMAICFTAKNQKFLNKRNILATAFAGIICVAGYYLAEAILFSSLGVPLASIPGNLIQAIGSGVLFLIVAISFDKANIKQRMEATGPRKTL